MAAWALGRSVSVPPPSLELLRRAADGNVRAQNELFDDWLPVVLGWCTRLGGPKVHPEDAAHDIMIVVLRCIDRLEKPDRFSAWLFGITRRVLRKHRTRAWVRRWGGTELSPNLADSSVDPMKRYEATHASQRVQEVLQLVPEKQREALVLCDLEGRTAPEVSKLLGIPVGTVSSRLRHGRSKFESLARRYALDQLVRADEVLT